MSDSLHHWTLSYRDPHLEGKASIMLLHALLLKYVDRLLSVVQQKLVQLIPVMVAGCRVLLGAGSNEDLLGNLTVVLCHVPKESALLNNDAAMAMQRIQTRMLMEVTLSC